MKYDFSVIVITYHPIKHKLLSTLSSILNQTDISFEIILADDGSDCFFQPEIQKFMAEHSFQDYQILAHPTNQGTVKNLLDALRISQGRYVKVISPGDLLYDRRTLRDLYAFMDKHDAKLTFTDMVYYSWENHKLNVHNVRNPWDISVYPSNDTYSAKKVLRHMTAYSDTICGASVFADRALLLEQLSRLQDIVIYAEDLVVQLIAFLGYRIWKYSGIGVWYEYGSGISTNGSAVFSPRLRADYLNFMRWFDKTYPGNPSIKSALKIRENLSENRIRTIHIHRLLHWGELLFIMRKKRLYKSYTAPIPDEHLFHDFYIEASEVD